MVTWETVRRLALALPGVEESTAYRRPAFRVAGKAFAGIGREGNEVLIARVGDEERDFLLETSPETYYLTPHYEGYPWILVRLARVEPEELGDVLTEAWLFTAPRRLAATLAREPGD